MNQDSPGRWPQEVARLAGRLGTTSEPEALESLWLLLQSALRLYLRLHSSRKGWIDAEDIEDIASQKSLELVQKLDSKTWDVRASSPGEIKAFVSTVARNSLVDLLRGRGRLEAFEMEPDRERDWATQAQRSAALPPDREVERRQFIEALRACAGDLKPKWRTIWFFRVFYDLPSKVIARHPEVQLRPSHVDVTLQRCRQQIRECIRRRGFEVQDLPPGSYAALWEGCRGDASFPHPEEADE